MAMNNTPKASGSGFKLKPGSKGIDSPGTFRQDSPLKALGFNMSAPGGYNSPVAKKNNGKTLMSYGGTIGPNKKKVKLHKEGGGRGRISVGGKTKIKWRDSYGGRTKNTDLLEVGKKAYRSAKSKAKKYYDRAKKWLKS